MVSVKYSGPWAESCYDPKTEVLTKDGWKFFSALSFEDELATLSKDHKLEYQHPTQIINTPYEGKMYGIEWRSVKIDLLVTNGHKLYVGRQKKDKTPEWMLERAEDSFKKSRYFKKNVNWVGREKKYFKLPSVSYKQKVSNQFGEYKEIVKIIDSKKIPMDIWLKFLGYFIADGSTTKNGSDYLVQIRQCKEEHKSDIRDLMQKINPNAYIDTSGTRFLIRDKQLFTYLKQLGKADKKHIPRECFSLSKRQLTILFTGLMNGDGSWNEFGGKTYHTSSVQLRDDFQELLFKMGISGSYRKRKSAGSPWKIEGRSGITRYDQWIIHINETKNRPFKCVWGVAKKGHKEKIVDYKGMVHCAKVPNGILYVRRNGCPVWSGNSGYAQANRNIIQSLHEVGVDLVTELQVYADHKTDYGKQLEIAKSHQDTHNNSPVKVLHITPNVYQKHKEVGKYHVGHLFWETTKMSPRWAWYLNEVREIWTGCEENVKTFKEMGFTGKIVKFPQPLDVDRTESPLLINNAQGFVFGSIFQWIERKDPKTLLLAYWKEFEHDRDVTLVIKTYGLGFEKHEAEKIYTQIAQWKKELGLANYPKTLIIDYLLTDKEIHQFYESCDCIVSAHRFEGWGVTQAEALVHAKPLISTNLGGVHEWLSDKSMYKVGYNMVDVFEMDWAEQYTANHNKWGQVNEDELRQKMRHVFNNREEAKKVGLQGQKEVREKFNFKTIGKIMEKRLQEIYKEQGL